MLKRILPKAQAAMLLYLATLPLFLLPAVALMPERMWIGALLPIPALLLTGGAGLVNAKRRTAALLAAILVMAAVCAGLSLAVTPAAALLFLPCLFVMLYFMPAMSRPAHQEWTAVQMGFGVILYIAAYMLKGVGGFAAAAAPLSWCFAAYLILCLFSHNRDLLIVSSPSASKTLLFANRKLLAILCLSALLLANLQAVGTAIRTAIRWIVASAAQIILWMINLLRPESGGTSVQQDGNPLEGLAEGSEPGAFAKFMEIVLFAVAALIAAVLLYFALRHLCRLLAKALRILQERWQSYRRKISADYVDTSESLLDWGEIRKTARARIDRFKRRHLPVPWEKLNPAQRVRRVYALLLRRPETQNPALTARETLLGGALNLPAEDAAALAALYDQARYSDHPIAAAEADALRKRAGV